MYNDLYINSNIHGELEMISNKKDIKNFATTALRIAVYSTLPGSVSLITKKHKTLKET